MSRGNFKMLFRIFIYTIPTIIISYLLYLSGYIGFYTFVYSIILYPFFVIFTLFIWMYRNRLIESKGFRIYKYIYIGLGGWITWLITFFGGAFILWCYKIDIKSIGTPLWLSGLIFFVIPWIVGGILGYYWGKKRGFKPYGI